MTTPPKTTQAAYPPAKAAVPAIPAVPMNKAKAAVKLPAVNLKASMARRLQK